MQNSFHQWQNIIRQKHKPSNSLMEFTPFGYMWTMVNSKTLVASHTIYSMLEKEPFSEFFTVQKWRGYVHPKDLYKLLQAEEELLQTGNPTLAEYRLITETGRHIYVHHHMYLAGLSHTEPKIMSIVEDITEQKRAEIILEAMNEGFFELDEHFAFRRINERALKFWSLHHRETIGKKFDIVFPQIEGTTLLKTLLRAQAEKISIAQDIRDPVTGHWLHFSVAPYADGLIVTFYDIQNEKEAEKKIHETKNLYYSLVENSPDAITRWSKELKLVYANKAFENRIGLDLASMYGKNSSEMGLPEEIAIPYMDSLRKTFKTAQPVEHYNRLQTPQGEGYFFSRLVPEKDEKGKIETVLAIARDITDIKKADEQVLQLKDQLAARAIDKYYTLFNSINQGFCIIEMIWNDKDEAVDYCFLETNPAFEKQTGITNATGRTMREIEPRHEAHWFEIYGEVAKTGKPVHFEQKAEPLMGGWYDVHAFPSEEGSNRVAVLFDDITERKKAEEQKARAEKDLLESEQKYRLELQQDVEERTKELKDKTHLISRVTEVMPDLLSVIDLETISASYINKRVLLEMGFNDLETLTEEERDGIIYPDDRLLIKKYFESFAAASDDDVIDVEYRAKIKTGEWQWFHAKGKVFSRDESGKPTHCVNIVQNIDKRKNTDRQIEDLNDALLEKNKQLEVLIAELKTFNSVAANYYTETLRHVYINLETIVTTDARNLSNSSRANIRRAQAAIQKMKLLTNDINNYLELYDFWKRITLIDPHIVLAEVKEKMQKKLEDSNATINIASLPNIFADPILFSKLMINIIDNSIKHKKPEVDPVININYSLIPEGNSLPNARPNTAYVNISVTDNGIGFREDENRIIFDLFSQLDGGKHKGSGIGLAICKKILEMHGGFIAAEGKPGEGATFNCYFPPY